MKIMILMCLVFSSTIFAKTNEYKMIVTEKGFEPSTLKVKANSPVILKVTRKTNATCAREIVIPTEKMKVELPLDKEVTIKVAAQKKGEVKFGCAMDMMFSGVMFVE
jgi:plastocyanin domain-containing protein